MVGSSTIRNYKGISGASIVSFCTDTSKYTVNFDWKQIETTVTDNATVVDQWVQGINDLYPANESVIVGLNVERSARKNRSATLHLCVDSKCLIVQLLYIGELPLSLKNFFIKPNFFFVGILIAKNISRIHDEYGGLSSGSVHADIKELAIQKWPDRWNLLGLEDLCSSVLGLSTKKPKLVSLSNWDVRVLSVEQVEYACIGAYVSWKVGYKLLWDC
ncbi:3'-5' exonuclease-like [Arachis duranensis]|uniref:3'-5' exonuclease-like n=1 Tax=Arachis duranensis TaxID=130453 RepID=A0A9C6TP49_ARADU|nr:3'-5' exonuclease-like [Arachis duranensis]